MPRRKQPVQEFETFEEAVAALRAQLEPGCQLILHDEHCEIVSGSSEEDCTCTPTVLIGGAQA